MTEKDLIELQKEIDELKKDTNTSSLGLEV